MSFFTKITEAWMLKTFSFCCQEVSAYIQDHLGPVILQITCSQGMKKFKKVEIFMKITEPLQKYFQVTTYKIMIDSDQQFFR